MRFAMLLTAITALWVQPANATALWTFNIGVHATGTNTPYDPSNVQFIPVAMDFNFSVSLPAFGSTSNLANRLPNVGPGSDPIGLGGPNLGALFGVLTFANGSITGSNFSYNAGPGCGALFTPGGACYDLRAATFAVGFVRSIDGPAPVPEPATWALMLVGFGAIGATMRRKQAQITALA